jgi:uncharacterized protein (TIGR03083 family)
VSSLADRTITAVANHHDALSEIVRHLSDEELALAPGASEWSVAQVLSHLGSGAEIMLPTYERLLHGGTEPDEGFNQRVWDRWNAMRPREQAENFLVHDGALTALLQGLSAERRETLKVDLPYLPAPIALATYAGLRLNEVALHGWDVRVALDPTAALDAEAAAVMAEHLSAEAGFMLTFTAKPDTLGRDAVVDAAGYALVIGEQTRLATSADDPSATFEGPLESVLRLIAGRLTPEHTPDAVRVTGDVSLDELRKVFPGY